jgi:hypothetical protein
MQGATQRHRELISLHQAVRAHVGQHLPVKEYSQSQRQRAWGSKPRSKQRSTSSTTTIVTLCKSHALDATRSIRRPGVATATSWPA